MTKSDFNPQDLYQQISSKGIPFMELIQDKNLRRSLLYMAELYGGPELQQLAEGPMNQRIIEIEKELLADPASKDLYTELQDLICQEQVPCNLIFFAAGMVLGQQVKDITDSLRSGAASALVDDETPVA